MSAWVLSELKTPIVHSTFRPHKVVSDIQVNQDDEVSRIYQVLASARRGIAVGICHGVLFR